MTAVAVLCMVTANAQDDTMTPATNAATPTEKTNVGPKHEAVSPNPRINQRREEMKEKFKNATPEEKKKMKEIRREKKAVKSGHTYKEAHQEKVENLQGKMEKHSQ